jgi:ribulose-phosphate 3-epimerase
MQLSVSLLSADFLHLADEVQMLNQSESDGLHLDIMDGVFVPNLSFGFPVLKNIAGISSKPLDAHLMIVEPQKFISEVCDLGVSLMNVHYEACVHLDSTITRIKAAGMKAGVTLNPHTPVELLEDIISELDLVLIMSVNPGFGGQSFIPNSINKIIRLKEMIRRKGLHTSIQVDGGINLETGKQAVEAGADILVSGNALFKSANPIEMIKKMKSSI